MTATDCNQVECDAAVGPIDVVVRHVERTCRTAIDGRRAARALSEWTQRFSLGEAEFMVLWWLRSASQEGLDQTTLAKKLAFSAAQVSATVERACSRGWICQRATSGDRRRRLWQLSAGGRELLEHMLSAAALLCYEPAAVRQPAPRAPGAANTRNVGASGSPGEAAA